jgi:hypothetical protein
MPAICFGYPAGTRLGVGNRNIAQPDLRSPRMMPHTCFRYPADVPRSMPFSCFSYSADVPQAGGNRDAAQSDVPGLRRMPNICFRY